MAILRARPIWWHSLVDDSYDPAMQWPYVKKCSIAAIEILHEIADQGENFDEQDGSFIMGIGQELQCLHEIIEAGWAIMSVPLVHAVQLTIGKYD